ncbi:MAG: heparinase II/III family protein [Thermoguttaceae bacterium]|nr:heparinase II/III family protein [Thermoguttaceae bacterium]
MFFASLVRRWNTIRYYRGKQIARRLLRNFRESLAVFVRDRDVGQGRPQIRGPLLSVGCPVSKISNLEPEEGSWRLSVPGKRLAISWPLDWVQLEAGIANRLGCFFLHYHEYFINALRQFLRLDFTRHVLESIHVWINNYPAPSHLPPSDAWHPYVISRRLPTWVWIWCQHQRREDLPPGFLASLAQQVRWLRWNLEFDLGGNHLLQNLRALAVAGAFFSGPEADGWLRLVRKLLPRELKEQILPHGEHFERAPAYHVDMLLALADIRDAFRAVNPSWSRDLEPVIDKMADFLGVILHPDGQIPLFGDSTLDLAPAPCEVFTRLEKTHPNVRQDSAAAQVVGQYWIYREGKNFLIFDAGPVGPDHLPAHAHADLLTIEASWRGERLIVDGGVSDYEDSPERAYCRGTAAHNTLEIDGQNQCDVWSRFRMGRRGWPGKLHCGQYGPFQWAACTHNAYRFLKVPVVGRFIACSARLGWIIADWAVGSRQHKLVSRLRVGPGWQVTKEHSQAVGITSSGEKLILEAVGDPGNVQVRPAPYFPLFGVRKEAMEVSQERTGDLPTVIAWHLRPAGQEAAKLSWERGRLRIFAGTQEFVFDLHDLWT